MEKIVSSVLSELYKPAPYSHKGQNGILCVISGSEKYHGAPLLAIKAASRFVDLIYFHSPAKLNEKILLSMKSKSNCFITIPQAELFKTMERGDCVLIGNGLELNVANKRLVNDVLKRFAKTKKIILDAGALRMADKKLFTKN
ncbi:MAG: NAD(P)H-hydrate dehydratase, partial [Candidatus Micrarchaeota archaeon]